MAGRKLQPGPSPAWELAGSQHGVLTRAQLLDLGFSRQAIETRIARGRLHPVARGIYAVGRPQLTRHGRWMAAVLSCGPEAFLSHRSAAALWEIGSERTDRIDVSLPSHVYRRRPGIATHRRSTLSSPDVTRRLGIPVTTPVCTLVDLASHLKRGPLERAISEADKRDLTDPEALRRALNALPPQRPGVAALRETLDRRTFVLTDAELERRFLALARQAGLPLPQTGRWVNGYKVDFYWPDLGIVVETDGLRYHRTAAQQANDRRRDRAHTAAGLTCLRFSHAEVEYERDDVVESLVAVRLRSCARR